MNDDDRSRMTELHGYGWPDDWHGLDLAEALDLAPLHLVPPSSWEGHIPFAFWLAKALRPRSFVELGTYTGNSYFAICQGLARFAPGARAFAVDSWAGDAHAGYYGEQVFQEVDRFNRAHFAQFSRLMRTEFDDARNYFPEAEIDLLHIDGLHSYEAVRHDFETWKSALSNRAVVLFHDINVREREFGVWRLWHELRETAPSFEFIHSHGLGVLGLGAEQAEPLRRLFELGRDEPAAAGIRQIFARRGETFQHQVAVEELRRHGEALQRQLAELTHRPETQTAQSPAELEWYRALLEERSSQVAAKDAMLRNLDALAAARGAALEARDALILTRDQQITQLLDELRSQAERYEARIAAQIGLPLAIAQADGASQAVAALQAQLDATIKAYVNSTSWKLTRPLRVLARLARTGQVRPQPAALPAPAPEVVEQPVVSPLKAAMRSMLMARLQAFLTSPEKLRLPRAEAPQVSILLVLYNQAELTFGCLGSILETLGGGEPAVEVVIVDNASTDLTSRLLDRIEGATILRNPSNLHFLKAVNLGAKLLRGRNLLLLNNDAQLLPGALASALETLDSAPDIGAVGGRIILPDGTLQEAGSIIWREGVCLGYGRGDDPANPDYMFQRDVDYCSGAFLLTPRAVFEELGGFDERFAPAYYEETDYCVRLWKSGRRVVYDPDATIIHYEFGSSSDASGQALQARNLQAFFAKHADWLAGQFEASGGNLLAARTARSRAPRILVLEDRVPKPELGAGYPRANRLLHELVAAGAQVTLFPMYRHPEDWAGVRRALDKRIEVLILAEASQIRPYLEARRGHFDAIIVCRPPNMAIFTEAVGSERDLIGKARLLYDAEALFVTRTLQLLEAEGEPVAEAERRRMIAQETTLTRLADAVISVSTAERQTLEDYGVKEIIQLGHALDDEPLPTRFEARDQIVFMGAMPDDNTPNSDSVRWFVTEVLPEIRRALGQDLRLTVIGNAAAPSIQAFDGEWVDLQGMVDELAPALVRARVMVVPTRFAAGIPHKVHQAAMLGIPMVVTDLIARQLSWTEGSDLLVASDPKAFAAACVRLYTDRTLWEEVRRNALERARSDCSPQRFSATIRKLVRDLPLTARRPEPTPQDLAKLERARRLEPPPEAYAGRPARQDHAVAVPFDYPPRPVSPRVAVMCHIFYPALASEMFHYLRRLPGQADLLVTTDSEEKRVRLQDVLGGWDAGALEIKVTPNRGRDIGPKLIAWAERYRDYDLVLHLHSKRSDHADFLAPWRSFLLENLLGSAPVVASIYDAFDRLPELGMVASQHYEAIRPWLAWNGNFAQAQQLARRMGFSLSRKRALDFPSGSMFWVRPAALQPLLDLGLAFTDFPEEGSQLDETPAHAIERLYFMICEHAGFNWLKVGQRALFMDTAPILPVASPEALGSFLKAHGVSLNGANAMPPAPMPPRLVTRVPPGLKQRLEQRYF